MRSAASVETNEWPRQAPAISLSALRLIEGDPPNALLAPNKRAFADGIILITYTGLRFPEVRRLRTSEVNEDSIYWTLPTRKTKKQRGQFWHWAFPCVRITGSKVWTRPLLDMRAAYLLQNGTNTSCTFMRVGQAGKPDSAEASPYSTTRRQLALLRVAIGDIEGGNTRCARRII